MRKFLHDAVDLALFRFKPLDHYVYEWWVPVLCVALQGTVLSAFATDLNTGVIQRTVFLIASNLVETLLASLFFGWWVRLDKRCTQKGTLFPLMALLQSAIVLLAVATVLPPGLNALAMLAICLYALVVQVRAISHSTGTGMGHTVAGMLAFLPAQLLLMLLSTQIATGLGWVDKSMQLQDDKADVTTPATKENTTKPTKSGEGES